MKTTPRAPVNTPTSGALMHVVYQTNHAGGAIGLARATPVVIAPAAQGVGPTTMDASSADDSGDDDGDGDDGDDDDDDDGDGDGDENDDENDPNPGP